MPFSGIQSLRGSDESVAMEPWQLDELRKCALDPIYFIKHYIYINTKDKGMQLFELRDYQEDVVKKFHMNRFIISKWGRQSGKCFFRGTNITIKNKEGIEMEFTIEEFFQLLEDENKNE